MVTRGYSEDISDVVSLQDESNTFTRRKMRTLEFEAPFIDRRIDSIRDQHSSDLANPSERPWGDRQVLAEMKKAREIGELERRRLVPGRSRAWARPT